MPRMDGRTTFFEMRKLRPEIPVILSSGYDKIELQEEFKGEGLAGFLQKPYRLEEVKALVIDVCAAAPGP